MMPIPINDEILGKAVDALYEARDRGLDTHQAAACVLADTHRLVAAVELRRIADELDAWVSPDPDAVLPQPHTVHAITARLRARATQLDGQS